jgi:hypothetical protein
VDLCAAAFRSLWPYLHGCLSPLSVTTTKCPRQVTDEKVYFASQAAKEEEMGPGPTVSFIDLPPVACPSSQRSEHLPVAPPWGPTARL